MDAQAFTEIITKGYTFKGDSIVLGAAVLDKEPIKECFIRIPLSTLNRHGLVAGATGTGKTKTLQVLTEQLSANGIPTLVMDIKGDLSGIAAKSDGGPKVDDRYQKIGLPFIPGSSPVEFYHYPKNLVRDYAQPFQNSVQSYFPKCSISMKRNKASSL